MATSPADITLFGATGFTGRLIAHALTEEGLSFRLAGRSGDKLAALSAQLPGRPAWLIADAAQPASLPGLFQGTRLLVNCAGPFTDLGERVVARAALSGVHYLDITNELGFVFRARGYDEMARKNGGALVPACGFEVALADAAAAIAARTEEALGTIEEAHIIYDLRGGSSQGTRRSAVRSLGTSWITYRDGDWKGRIPGGAVRQFTLPDGPRWAAIMPSSESVSLPSHLPVQRVDAWMTTAPSARFWMPVILPLLARLSRSILRDLILTIAARGGYTPEAHGSRLDDPGRAAASPFQITVQLRRPSGTHAITLQGNDPYGLTARIIAYYARRMTSPGYAQSGFLAPSQAVEPAQFLHEAEQRWGIQIHNSIAG
jgi:short subunit dehydrogenase-like uncharacterized protein